MKKSIRCLAIVLGLMILDGCTHNARPIVDWSRNDETIEMSSWGTFSIQSPNFFREKIIRDDGSIAFTTYDTKNSERKLDDFAVHLYNSSTFINCKNIGVSNPIVVTHLNNEILIWGKIDAYDAYLTTYPQELAPCSPPILDWKHDPELGPVRVSNDAAYAMCAEKNEMNVYICIRQITDNPQLAQKIFSTFKWAR